MNLRTIENLYARTKSYIERNGLSDAVIRTGEGIKDSINDYFYNHEMQSMTEHADMGCMDEADEPYKISLLIPAYNTDHRALRRLLNSLSKQSYRNFEAIIADASDDDSLIELVEEFRTEDENNTRLIYTRLKENKGISENTKMRKNPAKAGFFFLWPLLANKALSRYNMIDYSYLIVGMAYEDNRYFVKTG